MSTEELNLNDLLLLIGETFVNGRMAENKVRASASEMRRLLTENSQLKKELSDPKTILDAKIAARDAEALLMNAKQAEFERLRAGGESARNTEKEADVKQIASLKQRILELESQAHAVAVERDKIKKERDERVLELESRIAAFETSLAEGQKAKPKKIKASK